MSKTDEGEIIKEIIKEKSPTDSERARFPKRPFPEKGLEKKREELEINKKISVRPSLSRRTDK